jgi:phosphoribosylformimino-5-aminoimidazole carboxamide ribotide isomerase
MKIIPAIDLIDGNCVRLTKGAYDTKKIYSTDPLEMAKRFEEAGFTQLHLVDLDGAKVGSVVNLAVLERICAQTSLNVYFGGGIKTETDLEKVLKAGAKQVTIGSLAVQQPELLKEWIKRYGAETFIIGADVKEGKIAISGWLETSSLELMDFIQSYYDLGIRHVLCTDISKDGMLQGPAFELYNDIMQRFPDLQLIASGGVSGISDVKELKNNNIPAVVIGKAIYEGLISLRELKIQDSGFGIRDSEFVGFLKKRIIPCLDIKEGRTVKGINFEGLRDAGDPIELAKFYSDQGADELVFLDITATQEGRKTMVDMVRKVARQINIPFTVGGGISSVEDAKQLLENGADKISVNSSAVRNPDLIRELAERFGNQCVVLAIDSKEVNGQWKVYLSGGKIATELDLFEWAQNGVELGAGEILFTSMDNDGTKEGFALEALDKLAKCVNVPIIASGGCGSNEHFKEVFQKTNVDAALAASVFHFGEIAIPELKYYLRNNKIEIR